MPIPIFVIPGLTRNPLRLQEVGDLDAGPVIPDLIRDRHDKQKLNTFSNHDTASQVGIQKIQCVIGSRILLLPRNGLSAIIYLTLPNDNLGIIFR